MQICKRLSTYLIEEQREAIKKHSLHFDCHEQNNISRIITMIKYIYTIHVINV